jgi:branched-subunit amino acid aminotransferase/4-amino-4-deoxychorismate lyase
MCLLSPQVLWLFGEDHQITEVGSMNIFFVIKKNSSSSGSSSGNPSTKDASEEYELVTAPLTRGDILPGTFTFVRVCMCVYGIYVQYV